MSLDQSQTIDALLTRIDQLESRNAMRDLVSDYCHGFDKRDIDRFMAIWWPDCVWDVGPVFGVFESHDGIKRCLDEVLFPFWRETHHLTTNLRITFDDADNAQGVCDVDCMGADHEQQKLWVIGASYYDHFQRRDGVWRIKTRRVVMHYFNDVPGAAMSQPPAQS